MASIKCGNCKQTHITVSDVRSCYEITAYEARMQAESETWAEGALDRYYENRASAEYAGFDQWERDNGKVDFSEAYAASEHEFRSNIISGVRAHARKHYGAGWDIFIEAYTDEEIIAELERLNGLGFQMYPQEYVALAINTLATVVEVYTDRRRDIEATAF
jgi:hypothetical protein